MTSKKLVESNTLWGWREPYLAALFETDKQELPYRIAEAESALLARTRELFLVSEHSGEEGKALDKGLYALRALRDCFALKSASTRLVETYYDKGEAAFG